MGKYTPPAPPCEIPPSAGPWFVALTKSNQDEKFAWWLVNAGIPLFIPYTAFIPENEPKPLFNGTKSESHSNLKSKPHSNLKPLFSGIVFVGSPDTFNDKGHPGPQLTCKLKESRCVFGFLFTANQPKLKQELNLLACPKARKTLRVEPPSDVRMGATVRFLSPHPMAGLCGRIVDFTRMRSLPTAFDTLSTPALRRVFVDLTLLGQLVSVDVDPGELELIHPS